MSEKFILYENDNEDNNVRINPIKLDGFYIKKLEEYLSENNSKKTVNHIFSNAINGLQYFANPKVDAAKSKVLALGKVQSGKTSYFISSIAYAFDNDYDLSIIFGGTKNNLLDQNIIRISESFKNNSKVKIHQLNTLNLVNIIGDLNNGYKVIIMVLKNVSSESSNLYSVLNIADELKGYNVLIIDDEADEHTPGAPKLKSKNSRAGVTHDVITQIIDKFNVITILFVTATPQANLLISTLDELTPNYITLVEPGEGYTGGDAFHTSSDNPVYRRIKDSDDFKTSIPETYNEALKYFMLATTIKSFDNYNSKFSMLIHPSSLTKVQNVIIEKIEEDLNQLKDILQKPSSVHFEDKKIQFKKIFLKEFRVNIDFEMVFEKLIGDLEHYKTYIFNTSIMGKSSINEIANEQDVKYKIYVGGNMLSRGVTLENLIVTYIFRDSKVTAIDTLYQRARWFGYKGKYFEFCRLYMTDSLNEKFIAAAESERDLWQTLREFLETKVDIKKFKRLFTLNHEKMILTRKTVSKTITVERIKAGYSYDRSILFNKGDIEFNQKLVNDLIENYRNTSQVIKFAIGDSQDHLVISGKYTELFDIFIQRYKFQINSLLGPLTFAKIKNSILENKYEDRLDIIIMRYKTGQYRSLTSDGYNIKELPQGYNDGTNYSGDRLLSGFDNKLHLQIHLVYTDDKKQDYKIPILAFNNPVTKHFINYVTGDNYYESI